jgi:hypothetical protein
MIILTKLEYFNSTFYYIILKVVVLMFLDFETASFL